MTGHEEYYLGEDRGNAEAFAHMAIDAGASLVIASGPHVLRGMQFYQGHLIAYSLGNFVGYNNFGMTGNLDMSAILHVTLSPDGRFVRARVYPVQFIGQGQPVPGGGSVAFIAQLSAEDFGPTAARILPSGVTGAVTFGPAGTGTLWGWQRRGRQRLGNEQARSSPRASSAVWPGRRWPVTGACGPPAWARRPARGCWRRPRRWPGPGSVLVRSPRCGSGSRPARPWWPRSAGPRAGPAGPGR